MSMRKSTVVLAIANVVVAAVLMLPGREPMAEEPYAPRKVFRGSTLADPPRSVSAPLQAISVATRSVEKAPGLAEAHFNLANALTRVGLLPAARAELALAVQLDTNAESAKAARDRGRWLLREERQFHSFSIDRVIETLAEPGAADVLRPYLLTGRLPPPRDSAMRLRRASQIYPSIAGALERRFDRSLEQLSPGRTASSLAFRYYLAGALVRAGWPAEAEACLRQMDDQIYHASGQRGLEAQLVWEDARHRISRYDFAGALPLLENAQHRSFAAMFDELAYTVRMYLAEKARTNRDLAGAFRYADRGSSLEDVRRALAPDAAILRYTTNVYYYTDATVFIIRRDSVEAVTLPGVATALASMAAALRAADDSRFGTAAIDLHTAAFAPLAPKLEGVNTIAFVHDWPGTPFSALYDSARGEYLAERFTIVHARTAAQAIEASQRAREVGDQSLLAIAANGFNDPRVEPLPSVAREALDVAGTSRCARVLAGAQATPEAIERALAESAIVHYAGHIARRGLLLARSGDRDSLSVKDIAAFRLNKPRVVVLAACRGAGGDPYAAAPSVADAFVEAGVPTVIASTYDVDDAAAPPTMRRLHGFLASGMDAAEALRRTTIEELREGRGVPVSIRFHASGGTRSLVE